MAKTLRKLADRLPASWQRAMKRVHYSRQVKRNSFVTGEPEFWRLSEWLKQGDWSIDVGANVGHYTLAMSKLVGPSGRVLAFEPIPETFELLAANCPLSPHRNITLFNVAASSAANVVGMTIPVQGTWTNYYEAAIQENLNGDGYQVLAIPVDSIAIPHRVALAKVDAEGHDLSVIEGMKSLIFRDQPVIIVEGDAANGLLESFGYVGERNARSPNWVWRPA